MNLDRKGSKVNDWNRSTLYSVLCSISKKREGRCYAINGF